MGDESPVLQGLKVAKCGMLFCYVIFMRKLSKRFIVIKERKSFIVSR